MATDTYEINDDQWEVIKIVGFDVARDKSPDHIQAIVDNAPASEYYCTDGWTGCVDVVYPGRHVRNIRDKSDTFTTY